MIWLHAKGFENLYEVSSTGLVRSIPRVTTRSNGRLYTVRQKILKPAIDSCGYQRVGLMKEGNLVTKKVHRLICQTFKENIENKPQVNHLDGLKTNNNIDNLVWATASENVQHAFDTGLAKPKLGSNNPSAKIDEIQALTVKTLIKSGWSLVKISKEMNVSKHITKDINRGKTWKHINV